MRCPNPKCPDRETLGIAGEYRDELTHCPKCGARLVPSPTAVEEHRDQMVATAPRAAADWVDLDRVPSRGGNDVLVPILGFDYRHEAQLASSFLNAHGLSAVVSSDDCGALHPAIGFAREAFVRIPSSDVDEADDLLDAVETNTTQPGLAESLDGAQQDTAVADRAYRWAQRFLVAGILLWPWAFALAFVSATYGLRALPVDSRTSIINRRLQMLCVVSAFLTLLYVLLAVAFGAPGIASSS